MDDDRKSEGWVAHAISVCCRHMQGPLPFLFLFDLFLCALGNKAHVALQRYNITTMDPWVLTLQHSAPLTWVTCN